MGRSSARPTPQLHPAEGLHPQKSCNSTDVPSSTNQAHPSTLKIKHKSILLQNLFQFRQMKAFCQHKFKCEAAYSSHSQLGQFQCARSSPCSQKLPTFPVTLSSNLSPKSQQEVRLVHCIICIDCTMHS